MRTQTTRVIAGRVNANGTIAVGEFAVQKGGTGGYTVVLPATTRLIAVTASPGAAANQTADVSFTLASSFGVVVYTANTAAAIDAAFGFTAVVAA